MKRQALSISILLGCIAGMIFLASCSHFSSFIPGGPESGSERIWSGRHGNRSGSGEFRRGNHRFGSGGLQNGSGSLSGSGQFGQSRDNGRPDMPPPQDHQSEEQ